MASTRTQSTRPRARGPEHDDPEPNRRSDHRGPRGVVRALRGLGRRRCRRLRRPLPGRRHRRDAGRLPPRSRRRPPRTWPPPSPGRCAARGESTSRETSASSVRHRDRGEHRRHPDGRRGPPARGPRTARHLGAAAHRRPLADRGLQQRTGTLTDVPPATGTTSRRAPSPIGTSWWRTATDCSAPCTRPKTSSRRRCCGRGGPGTGTTSDARRFGPGSTTIATNACLTALAGRTRRPLPAGLVGASDDPDAPLTPDWEVPWLQPFPDARFDDPAARLSGAARCGWPWSPRCRRCPRGNARCWCCARCWSSVRPRSPGCWQPRRPR